MNVKERTAYAQARAWAFKTPLKYKCATCGTLSLRGEGDANRGHHFEECDQRQGGCTGDAELCCDECDDGVSSPVGAACKKECCALTRKRAQHWGGASTKVASGVGAVPIDWTWHSALSVFETPAGASVLPGDILNHGYVEAEHMAWRRASGEHVDEASYEATPPMRAQEAGLKFDGDKTPLDLFPPEALEEISKVLGYGAKKYAAHNWRKGISWSRYLAAALRHLNAWNAGEDVDPESGLSHLAHAGCCLAFLIASAKNGHGTDDRWKKP